MTQYARSAAVALLALVALPGCTVTGPLVSAPPASPAAPSPTGAGATTDTQPAGETGPTAGEPGDPVDSGGSRNSGDADAKSPGTHTGSGSGPKPKPSAGHASAGPRIAYFRIARKPKCAEGTAVFRADPVPLVIEWKITGATGGALSVDDPTGTPGTYGPVELEGSQEFLFSCNGEVGSTETHTYALYTTGGDGPARTKTLTASAKVLDNGLGTN